MEETEEREIDASTRPTVRVPLFPVIAEVLDSIVETSDEERKGPTE